MRAVNLLQSPPTRRRPGLLDSLARHSGTIIPLCAAAIWLFCAALDVHMIRSAISTQRAELDRIRKMEAAQLGTTDSDDRAHDIIRELDAHTNTTQVDHAIAATMNAAHPGIAFDMLTIESARKSPGPIDTLAHTLHRSYTVQIRGRGEDSIDIVRFAADLAGRPGFHSITTEQSPPGDPARSGWNNFLIRAQFTPTRPARENQR